MTYQLDSGDEERGGEEIDVSEIPVAFHVGVESSLPKENLHAVETKRQQAKDRVSTQTLPP